MGQKKTFSTRLDVACLKALKHLAVDEDKSIGVLLEEAIDDLIRKYKKKKKRWLNSRQGYLDMIPADLNPDKSEPNREEFYNARLNLLNFEYLRSLATKKY